MSKLESTKRTHAIFLLIVLVTGTFTALSPSFMTGAQAFQMDNNYKPDYGMNSHDYKQSYGKDSNNNYYKSKDSSNIKCNNINVNVNGFNGATLPTALSDLATEAQATADEGEIGASSIGSGSGGSDGSGDGRPSGSDTDYRFVCINNNNNNVVAEEQTSSLTVYKEVFGCDIITQNDERTMNCKDLLNNSPLWINCEDPPMSIEGFCQNLPENLFDIQVLGPQNNLIDEFVGPEDGKTFDNLQPGTYTVEEIKHETLINQLGESQGIEDACKEDGFTDGGRLDNQNAGIRYFICIEYEDEQGNDCNTITLAAGESRTCTVKNYIKDTYII